MPFSRRVHQVGSASFIRRSFAAGAKFVVHGYHAVPGMEPPPVSQVNIAHLNDRHFWKWGLSIKHIAELTGKPDDDVSRELTKQIGSAFPVADLVHNLTSVPEDLLCPISTELFKDPVVGPDGMHYERSSILECIAVDGLSPVSGETMDASQLVPADDTIEDVVNFRRQSIKKILEYTPVLLSGKFTEAAANLLDYADWIGLQGEDAAQAAEFRNQLNE